MTEEVHVSLGSGNHRGPLREEIKDEWLLALSGILSVLFGFILAIQPGAGALALVWIIALYAIIIGALLIMLGLRLRTWGRTASP